MIDCEECMLEGSSACADCLVSFVLGREEGPLDVDPDEHRVVRLLADAGIVPRLRHTRRAG